MKKQLGIAMVLSLGLLSSGAALANDAVVGALLGGGAGAIVGHSIGGRDGTIIGGALGAAAGAVIGSERSRSRVEYVAPQPVYYATPAYRQEVYYPQQEVYYAEPVRQRQVYYVERGYQRGHRRHHEYRDWDRHDRGWDGRR